MIRGFSMKINEKYADVTVKVPNNRYADINCICLGKYITIILYNTQQHFTQRNTSQIIPLIGNIKECRYNVCCRNNVITIIIINYRDNYNYR